MEQIQRKTRRLELVLGPEDGGVKVDTLLRRRLHLSGTVIRRIKWLPDGILVDGARVNTAFRPREGQTLSVRLSDPDGCMAPIGVSGRTWPFRFDAEACG